MLNGYLGFLNNHIFSYKNGNEQACNASEIKMKSGYESKAEKMEDEKLGR
jgi:hypothetical protein